MSTCVAHADANKFFCSTTTMKEKQKFLPRLHNVDQAFLIGNVHDSLYIYQPLPINIEIEEDGTFVVSDDIFLVYGEGKNLLDSLNDYVSSLIEYYWILENGTKINQFDNKQFRYLKTFIQPISRRGHHAIQANRD